MANNNLSINEIYDIFKSIANRHKNINDIGIGPAWHIGNARKMSYPYMWILLETPTTIVRSDNGMKEIQNTFIVRIGDRISDINNENNNVDVNDGVSLGEDSNNGLEIISDTQQILIDIINEFDQAVFYRNRNISISEDVLIEPFYEEDKDNVNGWEAEITLTMPNFYTYCDAPLDDAGE